MSVLGRARLVFLAAVALAGVILVAQFPVAALVRARGEAASAASQLSRIRAEDRSLSSEVRRLESGTAIAEVAHAEYGLVKPGEEAVVVMPSASTGRAASTDETSPLRSTTIPRSDLVPTDVSPIPGLDMKKSSSPSFWKRLVERLEFWKASS